jgi:hypothetical protein
MFKANIDGKIAFNADETDVASPALAARRA